MQLQSLWAVLHGPRPFLAETIVLPQKVKTKGRPEAGLQKRTYHAMLGYLMIFDLLKSFSFSPCWHLFLGWSVHFYVYIKLLIYYIDILTTFRYIYRYTFSWAEASESQDSVRRSVTLRLTSEEEARKAREEREAKAKKKRKQKKSEKASGYQGMFIPFYMELCGYRSCMLEVFGDFVMWFIEIGWVSWSFGLRDLCGVALGCLLNPSSRIQVSVRNDMFAGGSLTGGGKKKKSPGAVRNQDSVSSLRASTKFTKCAFLGYFMQLKFLQSLRDAKGNTSRSAVETVFINEGPHYRCAVPVLFAHQTETLGWTAPGQLKDGKADKDKLDKSNSKKKEKEVDKPKVEAAIPLVFSSFNGLTVLIDMRGGGKFENFYAAPTLGPTNHLSLVTKAFRKMCVFVGVVVGRAVSRL